jgi:hypothetical protein
MTNPNTKDNGRLPRKTLSTQLDRLDDILDGLADSLNGAVAQAVKDAVGLAVQEAVQGVLTEVLTNPELLEKLRPEPVPQAVPPTPSAPRPGWLSRLAGVAKGACAKACNLAKQACGKVVQVARAGWAAVNVGVAYVSGRVKMLARGLWAFLGSAAGAGWQARKPLLLALGVGAVLGLGCYLAGPVVSSMFSGFAGFVGSLVASAVNSLRHALLGFDFQDA